MIKNLLLLAAAVLVVVFLVKYVPQWIGEKKKEQSEQLRKMEDHAQKKAEDMVGGDSPDLKNHLGGEFNRKARDNATKANRRSMDRLKQMEADENE